MVPIGANATQVAAMGGGTPTPTPVSAPAGFTATVPYTIARTGTGDASTFATNYSYEAQKPAPALTIYVDSAGTPNGVGTSLGTAVNSLAIAAGIAKAAAVATRVIVTTGFVAKRNVAGGALTRSGQTYGNGSYRPPLTNALDANVSFEPSTVGGRYWSIAEEVLPAFVATADANIWVSTYTTEAAGNLVCDFDNMDVDGMPRIITPLLTTPASAAAPWPEINALWTLYSAVKDKPTDSGTYAMGASWLDTTNKKLYVRRFNNTQPVQNAGLTGINVLGLNSGLINCETISPPTANRTYLFQGLTTLGGYNGARVTASQTYRPTVYTDNCRYGFSYGLGGFAWTAGGGTCIHNNSVFSYNIADGDNPHGTPVGTSSAQIDSPNMHELGCKSKWNGWNASGTNNGTTAHEYAPMVRVNGEHLNSQDRSVHDIQAVKSWNLGCTASTRRTADATVFSTGYCASVDPGSQSGLSTTIWLDACKVVAGTFGTAQRSFDAYAGGTVNFANMTAAPAPGAAPNGGTFASYTP
jgi:hypothetical protein